MEEVERLFFQTYLKRQEISYDETSHTIDSLNTLNLNEKLELATALLGDLNHDKNEQHKLLEGDLNDLSIQLHVVDMRIVDLEKDAFSFKRDVLTNSEGDDKTSTTTANGVGGEKILRYLRSKMLQLDSTKDKLKLQQTDQKIKLSKTQAKLKQNHPSSNKLHFIDFHKYHAENKKYKEDLNLKTNKELKRIKIMFEKSEKELSKLKNVLKECKNEKQNVKKSIDLRKHHFERLQQKIQKQRKNLKTIKMKDEEQNQLILNFDHDENRLSCDKNIDVMDIVQQQSKLYELKNMIKIWTRKVEIAELSANK